METKELKAQILEKVEEVLTRGSYTAPTLQAMGIIVAAFEANEIMAAKDQPLCKNDILEIVDALSASAAEEKEVL